MRLIQWCPLLRRNSQATDLYLNDDREEERKVRVTYTKFQLRRIAKSIPPLYWLGGLVNYLKFSATLRDAEREYDRRAGHNLPPPMLRYRVHRSLDEPSYVDAGRLIAEDVVSALHESGIRDRKSVV